MKNSKSFFKHLVFVCAVSFPGNHKALFTHRRLRRRFMAIWRSAMLREETCYVHSVYTSAARTARRFMAIHGDLAFHHAPRGHVLAPYSIPTTNDWFPLSCDPLRTPRLAIRSWSWNLLRWGSLTLSCLWYLWVAFLKGSKITRCALFKCRSLNEARSILSGI